MSTLPFAITLPPSSSTTNRTGAWRTERPVYRDLVPPCADACPAGEPVREWLHLAQEGRYEEAWRLLVRTNPMPAVMGRVCYHPCETACNRVQVEGAVGINAVERFLGDAAIRAGWRVAPGTSTGRRVLVVGAGPAGLAAAWHLRLAGHDVVIRDAADVAGGMLRLAVPAYRLPAEVLDAEARRILDTGVCFEAGVRVDDIAGELRGEDPDGRFDAALVAVGATRGVTVALPVRSVPGQPVARVLEALGLLRAVATGATLAVGHDVLVYGGGNTAVDAARTARRLGAERVRIVYRRTQGRMPAQATEFAEALAEGVSVTWLTTITGIRGRSVATARMRLDDDGNPRPTGEAGTLVADTVVLALGQETDLTLVGSDPRITVRDGVIDVDEHLMTGAPGVFAAGDAIVGQRTATSAIGTGVRAARAIDAWLSRSRLGTCEAQPAGGVAGPDVLNLAYYPPAARNERPVLTAEARAGRFAEVVGGLTAAAALAEARRCMSCGGCFECDNCYALCPDDAIVKLGPGRRYEIDLEYCKGCGICVAECPAGAIALVPEGPDDTATA